MKNNKIELLIITCALLFLTGMGAIINYILPIQGQTASHYLIWIAIAMAVAWAATKLRFRQWLMLSAIIGAVWLTMIFAAHSQEMVDGSHRYLNICELSLDTYVPCIAVCSLVLATIRRKSRMTTATLLISVLIAAMAFTGWKIAEHPMRRARVAAFFTENASSVVLTPQEQERNKNYATLKECFWGSKWVGKSDSYLVDTVPYSITSEAAVALGRIVPVTWLFLFAVVAFLSIRVVRRIHDPASRLYLGGFTAWLCLPSFIQAGENLHLLPSFSTLIPLINSNGLVIIIAGMGAGIAISAIRDDENEEAVHV